MKKLLFFIIVAIAQVNTLQADDVSVEQALQVARQFAIERSSRSGMQKAPSAIAPSLAYTVKSLQNNDTHNEASLQNNDTHNNVYVINLGEDQGFVVVSGETGTTAAVLGYCDQGTFSYDDAPCNLKALLQQYAGQIDCLRENRNLTPRSTFFFKRHRQRSGGAVCHDKVESRYALQRPVSHVRWQDTHRHRLYGHRHGADNGLLEIPSSGSRATQLHVLSGGDHRCDLLCRLQPVLLQLGQHARQLRR